MTPRRRFLAVALLLSGWPLAAAAQGVSYTPPPGAGGGGSYDSSAVNITGGTITGLSTPLPIASGGTAGATAAAARTALELGTLSTQSGTFSGTSSGTNTGDQTTVSGNAGTATALQTARTINGVSFNGTADISIPTLGSVVNLVADSTISSTALVNITELSFAVEANSYYAFDLWIIGLSAANADFKFGWSLPAGATMIWEISNQQNSGATAGSPTTYCCTESTAHARGATDATPLLDWYHGIIVTAGTAGTAQAQFAQNSSQATYTYVRVGSYITYRKLN